MNLRSFVSGFLWVFVASLFLEIPLTFAQVPVKKFSDVSSEHKNFQAIQFLQENEVVEGYTDNTFKPENEVNRAEELKILIEGQGISPDPEAFRDCFPDVTDQWFAKYVCYAKEAEWVEGYPDGLFRPEQTVNKVESLKMLVETQGAGEELEENIAEPIYEDTSTDDWYAPYVHFAKEKGILEETGTTFEPGNAMKRGGIAENLYRFLQVEEQKLEVFPDVQYQPVLPKPTPKPQAEPTSQPLPMNEIGLGRQLLIRSHPATPETTLLPKNSFATVFQFDLTARNKSVVITSLGFIRGDYNNGGSDSDFSAFSLYRDIERLTGWDVLDSTHMVDWENLSLLIPSGETVTLTLKAKVSAKATTDHASYFVFGGSDMIITKDPTELLMPEGAILGPVYTILSSTSGTLNINAYGSIPNPSAGQKGAKIAAFQLTPQGEDVRVRHIALHIGGTVDALRDLSNFRLYAGDGADGGMFLARAAVVEAPYTLAYFVIPGGIDIIDRGWPPNSPVFTVFADVSRKADNGDTINVYLEKEQDLSAVGLTYGVGVHVDNSGFDSDNESSHSVISNTEMVPAAVRFGFEGPLSTEIPVGSKNVRFLNLSISPENDIEIRKLTFNIYIDNSGWESGLLWQDSNGSFVAPNFSNIRLVEYSAKDGSMSVIMGPKKLDSAGSDTSQDITFQKSLKMVGGGTRHFSLIMDVADNPIFTFWDGEWGGAPDPDRVSVSLQAVGEDDIIHRHTGVADIAPTGPIKGNPMTLTGNSFVRVSEHKEVSGTAVYGSSEVPLLDFLVSAKEDVTVEKLYFSIAATGNKDGLIHERTENPNVPNFYNLRLLNAGTKEQIFSGFPYPSDIDSAASDLDTLWNFVLGGSWSLKKGTTQHVLLVVDITNDPDLKNEIVGEVVKAELFQGKIREHDYDIVPTAISGANVAVIDETD